MNGIILSKKRSKRLSCNKALIKIEDEFLIERVIRVIKPYCKSILFISDDERLDRFGKRYSDIFKGKGPLSGLYTGLYYSDCKKNLVLASDMPLLDSRLVEYIQVPGNWDCIVPIIDGNNEPLCAIYSKKILPKVKEQIEKGKLSLNSLIKRLNVKYINCNEFRDSFFNLNTDEDLQNLLRVKCQMKLASHF